MRKNKETSWLFDVYVVGIDNVSYPKALAALQIRKMTTLLNNNSAEDLNKLTWFFN